MTDWDRNTCIRIRVRFACKQCLKISAKRLSKTRNNISPGRKSNAVIILIWLDLTNIDIYLQAVNENAKVKMTTFWYSKYTQLEICEFMGYYAASSGNPLPTFRNNVSVPSSRVKKSKKERTSWPFKMEPICCTETSVNNYHSTYWSLKMRPIRCSETSVKDYHSTLRNIPEESRFHGLFTLFTFSNLSKVIVQSEQCKPAFSSRWRRHFCRFTASDKTPVPAG